MTKEELKQEAEEYALNQWEGNLPWSVIQKAYYDGALPREKRIAELEAQIEKNDKFLEAVNYDSEKVPMLEAQIEKMKSCRNCKNNCCCNWQEPCRDCDEHSNWKLRELAE